MHTVYSTRHFGRAIEKSRFIQATILVTYYCIHYVFQQLVYDFSRIFQCLLTELVIIEDRYNYGTIKYLLS